jgi:glycyl-tRNA synthetase
VLRFHPALAPIKCAILPLVKKDGLPEIGLKLHGELKRRFNCFYDEKSAVGRRYRRQDEAGTPYCFTIDGQTKEDQTVTVRERDSMKQERIHLDSVLGFMREKLDL